VKKGKNKREVVEIITGRPLMNPLCPLVGTTKTSSSLSKKVKKRESPRRRRGGVEPRRPFKRKWKDQGLR